MLVARNAFHRPMNTRPHRLITKSRRKRVEPRFRQKAELTSMGENRYFVSVSLTHVSIFTTHRPAHSARLIADLRKCSAGRRGLSRERCGKECFFSIFNSLIINESCLFRCGKIAKNEKINSVFSVRIADVHWFYTLFSAPLKMLNFEPLFLIWYQRTALSLAIFHASRN